MTDEFLGIALEYTSTYSSAFTNLQRLISTALAKPDLAARLLADPAGALGSMPANIHLTDQERALLTQVGGTADLTEFAARLDLLMQNAAGSYGMREWGRVGLEGGLRLC